MSYTEPLFPYQLEGAAWLASKTHALLADEMGLGKSAQVIRATDLLNAGKILVICPAAARLNWQREFGRFSTRGHRPTVVTKPSDPFTATDSLIVSYDFISKNPNLGSFDVVVADESHFIKGIETKRTAAILGASGTIHRTKRFWAISGTPAPNNFGEMWPLLFTLGITPLKYPAFVKRYCNTYEWKHGPVITGNKKIALPEMRALLAGVMLRRKKDEVMKELPPIFYQHQVVDPGPADLELDIGFVKYIYPSDKRSELEEDLRKERQLVEAAVSKTALGADGMKMLEALAKSVSTLRRYSGLQKVQPVADIFASELEAGAYEKIVIFAIHRSVIEGLRQKLSRFGVVTLYGGTPSNKRDENIDSFQNDPKTRVFIGNIAAAGTAITLTAAHHVAFVESEWVPAMMAQAAMRCHRIGQTKPVTVRFFSLSNPLDERINERLKQKTRDLTEIFDVQELRS